MVLPLISCDNSKGRPSRGRMKIADIGTYQSKRDLNGQRFLARRVWLLFVVRVLRRLKFVLELLWDRFEIQCSGAFPNPSSEFKWSIVTVAFYWHPFGQRICLIHVVGISGCFDVIWESFRDHLKISLSDAPLVQIPEMKTVIVNVAAVVVIIDLVISCCCCCCRCCCWCGTNFGNHYVCMYAYMYVRVRIRVSMYVCMYVYCMYVCM